MTQANFMINERVIISLLTIGLAISLPKSYSLERCYKFDQPMGSWLADECESEGEASHVRTRHFRVTFDYNLRCCNIKA